MAALGRVLIVDDEPHVGSVFDDVLTDQGYVVKVVTRGSEALGLMPIFRPDVVLLDLKMPEMPGVEVLQRLCRDYPDVPVVVVTGNEDEDLARSTLSTGAFDYIHKPFHLAVLERVVAAAVGHRRVSKDN